MARFITGLVSSIWILTTEQRRFLQAVIDSYIQTDRRSVHGACEDVYFSLSSATLRNIMAELEEMES